MKRCILDLREEGTHLIEGTGKDIKGVLLLYELQRDAVKEPPRLLVVGCPVLGQVLLARHKFRLAHTFICTPLNQSVQKLCL